MSNSQSKLYFLSFELQQMASKALLTIVSSYFQIYEAN